MRIHAKWVSNLPPKWPNLPAFLLFSLPPNALGKGKNYKGVKGESGSGQFALQGYGEEGSLWEEDFILSAFSYSAPHDHLRVM